MSIEAVAAVLNINYGDPTRKLIALGLANHAHRDGTSAWPAVATLAGYAGCSERTVQRHLKAMLEEGWIRYGDQGISRGRDPRYRPTVYDLRLAEPRGDRMTPLDPTDYPRGDTGGSQGVTDPALRGDTALSPEPSLNHPENHHSPSLRSASEPPGGREEQPVVRESQLALVAAPTPAPGPGFDEFWATYPRKVGKPAALKAWRAALKTTRPEVILAGLDTAKRAWTREGRDPRFIPHPTTWLNQGRWADEHDTPQQPAPSWWDGVPKAHELPGYQAG